MNHKAIYWRVTNLAVAGLWAFSLPGIAQTPPNTHFKICTGRLINVGVSAEAAAQSCTAAPRPRDLGSCVYDIKKRTEIDVNNALAFCQKSPRPEDLAFCVVNIRQILKTPDENSKVLEFCDRSKQPVRFAECVATLTFEIKDSKAMDTCFETNELPSPQPGVTQPN